VLKFLTVNKKILIAFLLSLGIFVLLSPEIKESPRFYLFERPVAYTINLIQSGLALVSKGGSSIWNGYIDMVGVKEENRRLMEENKRLRAELVQLEERSLAYDRLMQLLKMKETLDVEYIVATIVAKDPASWYKAVVINKGEEDGLRPNMGVITVDGVVGRIVKTAPRYSRVLLLSDRNSAIAGLIQRTRHEGIIVGGEGRVLRLKYIAIDSDVQKGDLVLTSGTDGIFPEGIVIGRVRGVESPKNALFHTVEVEPNVDLWRIREVMVLKTQGPPVIERLLKEDREE